MKFLLILISTSSVFSLSNIFSKSKKMCSNCQHFIKPDDPKQVGKCSLFPILNDMDSDTEDVMNTYYLDCIRSRSNHYFCGEKGRYYEKSIPVEVTPFLTSVDPSFFDDFDFEQYIQFL